MGNDRMEPAPKPKAKSWVQSYAQSGQYVGAGIQMAVSTFLCLLGGNWLDQHLGTSPFLLILGTFVGAVSGFFNFYKILTSTQNKPKKEGDPCGKA